MVGRPNAQDALAGIVVPVCMWVLFFIILGSGGIWLVFDKGGAKVERSYLKYWLILPAVLMIWSFIAVFFTINTKLL
jgi:uncharacterized RDD family membrane protein YckC